MDENRNNVAETAERLTRLAANPLTTGIQSILAVQDASGNIQTLDLEPFLPRPRSLDEAFTASSVAGFIDYVNLHRTRGASIIFFDLPSQSFEAVLDYHDKDGPSHATHIARFTVPQTTAFKAWLGANNKAMTQEDFALFIEANMVDIVEPAGATMMEVVTSLRALKKVEFASDVNLDNGAVVFAYKEEIKGTYRDGQTTVPQSFKIALPIFRGLKSADGKEVAYALEAKLRYRIKDGTLVLWYSLPAIERAVEKAVEDVANAIGVGTTVQVIEGHRGNNPTNAKSSGYGR